MTEKGMRGKTVDAECVDYRQRRTRFSTNIPEPVGRKLN